MTQGDVLAMKTSLKAALAGLALMVGASSPALAQRADDMRPGQGGGQHACYGDAQSICSEFIPDRAKVASCLFKNRSKLTAACRAEISGGKPKVSRKAKGKRSGKRSKRRR
jgi:hypothetical protein